jgi:hypothetical protein
MKMLDKRANVLFLYLLQCIITQACSPVSSPTEQVLTTSSPTPRVTAIQSEDSNKIKFDAIAKVVKINLEDRSQKAGVQDFYTNLTIEVESTFPPDILSKLPVKDLSFSRKTNHHVDINISVHDKVIITVVGNDFSNPNSFRIHEMTKLLE